MRYEEWCAMRGFGARLAGDTSPTAQERAKAKRARKSAKRIRDAERTAEGRKLAHDSIHHSAWCSRAWRSMGEAQP